MKSLRGPELKTAFESGNRSGDAAFNEFQKPAVWLIVSAMASILTAVIVATPLSLNPIQPRFDAIAAAEHWTVVDAANGNVQVKTAPVILRANSIPRIDDTSRPLPGAAPCPEPPEQRAGSAYRVPTPCLPAHLTTR